ncbi:MAG: hypothetical protein M3P18_04150 [Actinomycetota bacterium]|nr:hypothetical protein [Actinomycetota bacterium]
MRGNGTRTGARCGVNVPGGLAVRLRGQSHSPGVPAMPPPRQIYTSSVSRRHRWRHPPAWLLAAATATLGTAAALGLLQALGV